MHFDSPSAHAVKEWADRWKAAASDIVTMEEPLRVQCLLRSTGQRWTNCIIEDYGMTDHPVMSASRQ